MPAYVQSQANEKCASAAEPRAAHPAARSFFLLSFRAQGKAGVRPGSAWGPRGTCSSGQEGWLVASFALPETWLHGPPRVRMQNMDQ